MKAVVDRLDDLEVIPAFDPTPAKLRGKGGAAATIAVEALDEGLIDLDATACHARPTRCQRCSREYFPLAPDHFPRCQSKSGVASPKSWMTKEAPRISREDAPVLPDRRDEPEEVERAVGVLEPQARLHEHRAARPDRLEPLAVHALRAGLARVPYEELPVRFRAQERHKLTTLEFHDDGKGSSRQRAPARARRLGLEPQLLGGQQQLRVSDAR